MKKFVFILSALAWVMLSTAAYAGPIFAYADGPEYQTYNEVPKDLDGIVVIAPVLAYALNEEGELFVERTMQSSFLGVKDDLPVSLTLWRSVPNEVGWRGD